MSSLNDDYRLSGVLLVPVDDQFALIDQPGSRVFIINSAAAWVWTRLGTDASVPMNVHGTVTSFLHELRQRNLLGREPALPVITAGCLNEQPRILSHTPLQVAANNSSAKADPFLAV